MMVQILAFFAVIVAAQTVFAGCDKGDFAKDKKQAIESLKKKKVGFDHYLADQVRRDKNRLAEADQMKKVRKAYSAQLEKARKSFRRTNTEFPMAAYKVFIKERNRKDEQSEKARCSYANMKKEMREIFENKEYNIDGNKEFKL